MTTVFHRPGAVVGEGTEAEEWICQCGWEGADYADHVAALLRPAYQLCDRLLALADAWDHSVDWRTATSLSQSVGLSIRSLVEDYRYDTPEAWREAAQSASCKCPTAECCSYVGCSNGN